MKPLIGVTGRPTWGFTYDEAPFILKDARIDLHWAEYSEKVATAGGLPVQLPLATDPEEVVDRLDGLLLTGGTDVMPQAYGSTPGTNLERIEPERDEFEFSVLNAAAEKGIPVLGICRGNQVINVTFGGTLIADLHPDRGEGHSSMRYPRHIGRHEVTFEAGSTLADIYGPAAMVNSFHHQSVDIVGNDLRVTGRTHDGVVEAIEHVDKPIVGVQWHPEMMRFQEPIWDWFVKACN